MENLTKIQKKIFNNKMIETINILGNYDSCCFLHDGKYPLKHLSKKTNDYAWIYLSDIVDKKFNLYDRKTSDLMESYTTLNELVYDGWVID